MATQSSAATSRDPGATGRARGNPKYDPAYRLLAFAHPPETASALFTEKVVRRPLLFAATSAVAGAGQAGGADSAGPSGPASRLRRLVERRKAAKEAERARRKSGRPKPLSAKKKRQLGLRKVDGPAMAVSREWATYVPLWHMWAEYARKVLGVDLDDEADRLTVPVEEQEQEQEADAGEPRTKVQYISPQTAGPIIASMDFHGSLVEVVRSKCHSVVGITGIVLRDTKSTFDIITPKNKLKTIPKEHTHFLIRIPLSKSPEYVGDRDIIRVVDGRFLSFTIDGSRFNNRAPDRATKKIKDVFGKNSKAGGS